MNFIKKIGLYWGLTLAVLAVVLIVLCLLPPLSDWKGGEEAEPIDRTDRTTALVQMPDPFHPTGTTAATTTADSTTQDAPEATRDPASTTKVPTTTKAPTTTVPAPRPEPTPEDNVHLLYGSWVSVTRSGQVNHLSLLFYTFNEDGTGYINDLEYTYYPDYPEGDTDDGWAIAGRGYATMYIRYTLKGNQLSITYLGYLAEEWGEIEEYTEVFTIFRLDNGSLVINDDYGTYVRDTNRSLKELCNELGVDYKLYGVANQPQPDTNPLVGDWASVSRVGQENTLVMNYIRFNADGTGLITDEWYTYWDDHPLGDWGDGWTDMGQRNAPMRISYIIEGSQLQITYLGYIDQQDSYVYSERFTVYWENDDRMILSDSDHTYIRDINQSVNELCDEIGVDYTVYRPDTVGSVGLSYEWSDSSYTVKGNGVCVDSDVVIPSVFRGGVVTGIGWRAFINWASLKSLSIPGTVSYIEEEALLGCRNLRQITYDGTMKEWNEIRKGLNWNAECYNITVRCTDGTITLN